MTVFTNNITHELKTPIAVAYAADDTLLNFDASSDPTRLKKYLTVIQEQLATLSELVEQILSASMERRKNMSLEIDDQNVSEVVERVVANQRFKCTKPFNVSVDIPSSLMVKAEHLNFKNIIVHLADILTGLWGDFTPYNAHSLQVFITKLRHKLAEDENIRIINVRGIGYKLIY